MVAEEVEYLFSELTDEAKASALEKYRDWNVGHDWWDGTYEDAVRMAALLGIEIDQHNRKTGWCSPKIYFSGFWSQGDGASFEGTYRPKGDAIEAIKAECNDETLIDLATRLTVINVQLALFDGFEQYRAQITQRGSYSHSNTMHISIEWEPLGIECESGFPDVDEDIAKCLREFADWVYKNLEAEHEYLTSDECLSEQFEEAETKFTEDGAMI